MRTFALLVWLVLAGCASPKGGASGTAAANASGGTAVTLKSARLSWTASLGSPSGYLVQQSNDGTVYTTGVTTATTSMLVGSLTPGATYYFRVKAFNGGGYSAASNVITLRP